MNLKIGTADAREFLHQMGLMFRHLRPQLEKMDVRAGLYIDVESVEPESTDDQREGFHVLIDSWLRLDPSITYSAEDLKGAVCKAMWGVVKLTGPGGQEQYIAARRTTRKWDTDKKRYVRSVLSREDYSALIDFTYQMASEDGIQLPELEKAA